MITSSGQDFNLSRICTPAIRSEFGASTPPIHLYGLKDRSGQADVVIRSMDEIADEILAGVDVLRNAGISVHTAECCDVDSEDDEFDGIRIGLTHRIREDVSVCKRVVRTLLAAAADKLEIDCSLSIERKPQAVAAAKAEAKEIK